MTSRRSLSGLMAAVMATALISCASGDGKTLRPPTAPAPTTTVAVDTADSALTDSAEPTPGVNPTLPAQLGSGGLQVAVPWVDGGEIDRRFGCDGPGISPSIAWQSVPEGTAEIAVVISDLAGQVHWLLLGIDPAVIALPEGLDTGALEAQGVQVLTNGFGVRGWTAPCPAEGTSEQYLVTVHALNQQIEGAEQMDTAEVAELLGFVSIEVAEATGIYSRPG